MADDPGDANMNGMPSRCGLARLEVEQLASVLRRYPQVRRAVLFGSRAKGTARANSDIDIALYGDLDDLTVERIALEMGRAAHALPF